MSDFPSYSVEGLIGLSTIHAEWADYIFYFEDQNYEGVYERLIRRLTPQISAFVIACTGGKSISKKLSKKKKDIKIPALIIVDKDYDDLLCGTKGHKETELIYLERYSLENYLANEDALTEIATEMLAGASLPCDRKAITTKINDKNKFRTQLEEELIELGRYFIYSQRKLLPIQTSKTESHTIFDNADPTFPIPSEWALKFKSEFNDWVSANADWLTYENQISQGLADAYKLPSCCAWSDYDLRNHIVGKHLLFGLTAYIDARLGTSLQKLKTKELYLRIISHLDLNDLDFLKDRILLEINAKNTMAGSTRPAQPAHQTNGSCTVACASPAA